MNSCLRNVESGKFRLRNPQSWALESRKQLNESGIPPVIGILNPSSTDKESGFQTGIRNPWRGFQNAGRSEEGRDTYKQKHKHKKNA